MRQIKERIKAWLTLLAVVSLCFLPVGCVMLQWKGCLEAEGSFFYCLAVLTK